MDILKYLDVLIGLAVVMVLLSPLVSAMTQLWVWLLTMRAGCLEVALKQLILQMNGNPYEQFEAVRVSKLPANTAVTMGPAASGNVTATSNPTGEVTFQNDIPGRLKQGHGVLALSFQPPLPPGPDPEATFLARGAMGDWEITTPVTDANGVAIAKYAYPGPGQFASQRAEITLPEGTRLRDAKIASGPLRGTLLSVTAGPPVTITYPANAQPVPASHDIELTLINATGPAAGQSLTLKFERNTSFDRSVPTGTAVQAQASLIPAQAQQIARAALLHPMIAQPPFFRGWLTKRMRGEVIEREELIRVLLGFAAGEGSDSSALEVTTRDALRQVLADNDVADPGRALSAIRTAAQQLEKSKPEMAAHVRLTTAILEATPSAFVGKINNWFDQVMDRTITAYRFRTQLITIVAAALVALAIQMDSIDLLKRLSTDDKLRNALVDQAKEQQRRIEELAKTLPAAPGAADASKSATAAAGKSGVTPGKPAAVPGQPAAAAGQAAAVDRKPAPTEQKPPPADPKGDVVLDEIQRAKVRRDEIETNLTKLRDPSLAILPEHFIWQPLPEGSLVQIPDWLRPTDKGAKAGERPPTRLELVVGASTYAIEPRWPTDTRPGDPLVALHDAINNAATPVKARIEVAIKGAKIGEHVRVTSNGKDLLEFDDPLASAPANGKSARLAKASLSGGQGCAVSVREKTERPVDCDLPKIVDALKRLDVDVQTSDALVLESRRNPPLQLRQIPGHPETNLLDGELRWKCSGLELLRLSRWLGRDWSDVCLDYPMLKHSWLGLLVTWMLLSLGAPFWYDALKDMLKLRSVLARKDDTARHERQTDTAKDTAGK
jgi:hypothetical protein